MYNEPISRLPATPLPDSALRRLAEVGRDPINLHRSLAHAPAMLAPLLDLVHAVRYEAAVPRALRELLICRLAQIEGSVYELAHHLPMARAAGVSEEQLEHLDRWSEADCFDAAETAVLAYAEHLGNGTALDADLLGAQFSPAEQTELTVAGATYIAVARILRALDVRIDSHLA